MPLEWVQRGRVLHLQHLLSLGYASQQPRHVLVTELELKLLPALIFSSLSISFCSKWTYCQHKAICLAGHKLQGRHPFLCAFSIPCFSREVLILHSLLAVHVLVLEQEENNEDLSIAFKNIMRMIPGLRLVLS